MEVLNILEQDENSWEHYFLLEAVTTVFNKMNYKDFDGRKAEITLTINGIECPFVETVRLIGLQHEAMIERKAKRLIEERLNEELFSKFETVSNLVSELEIELKDRVDEMLRKLDWNEYFVQNGVEVAVARKTKTIMVTEVMVGDEFIFKGTVKEILPYEDVYGKRIKFILKSGQLEKSISFHISDMVSVWIRWKDSFMAI